MNVCRLVLAVAFVFSGFVKAVDPLGTQYKMGDYLAAMGLQGVAPDWLTLGAAVVLAGAEFTLGICLLFAIQRRMTSRVALALMVVMTLITVWVAVANPVEDCGCFGDALKLTNTQTLLKNVVLLACAIVVAWRPLQMMRLLSESTQWIAVNYTIIFVLAVSLWCLYALPIFDFRPYHVGADIRSGAQIPEGAPQPQFETVFVMKKDGQTREFTTDNYPDSTWEFVDSRTTQTSEGYVPEIHDFSIELKESGEDITQEVLESEGYTFLLIAPHLETADDSNFGNIDEVYSYAQDQDVPFYCLTASGDKAVGRWQDITGAEYPFCTTDETTLKTIIRSNPGLVLLKDGVVIRKWSHNLLPTSDELKGPLATNALGRLPKDSVAEKIVAVLLWFVLPLALLTLADRTWAWSKWVRRRKLGKLKIEN